MINKDFIKERIYYIRSKHNKSARSLSLELFMSSEYINQIETGRLTPSLDFLIRFCDYFNMSLTEFFDEEQKYLVEYKELNNILNNFSQDEVNKIIDGIKILAHKK